MQLYTKINHEQKSGIRINKISEGDRRKITAQQWSRKQKMVIDKQKKGQMGTRVNKEDGRRLNKNKQINT